MSPAPRRRSRRGRGRRRRRRTRTTRPKTFARTDPPQANVRARRFRRWCRRRQPPCFTRARARTRRRRTRVRRRPARASRRRGVAPTGDANARDEPRAPGAARRGRRRGTSTRHGLDANARPSDSPTGYIAANARGGSRRSRRRGLRVVGDSRRVSTGVAAFVWSGRSPRRRGRRRRRRRRRARRARGGIDPVPNVVENVVDGTRRRRTGVPRAPRALERLSVRSSSGEERGLRSAPLDASPSFASVAAGRRARSNPRVVSVHGLAANADADDLHDFFSDFGTVLNVEASMGIPGVSSSLALVEFADERDAFAVRARREFSSTGE